MEKRDYYDLLYKKFGDRASIHTELINLEAILHLPKGTEHFVSDLHGEADAFEHILKNGAGIIREKLFQIFPEYSESYLEEFALFIYYPKEYLGKEPISELWYTKRLDDLIILAKDCAGKYTRSKLRKALPESFAYLLEELIYRSEVKELKNAYYQSLVKKLVALKEIDPLLIALCETIQRLVVDHLHVVGDIFDRGPDADKVMDQLMQHHSVDIQWGNHDILWLGAFAGSKVALMALLRIAARYNYLSEIEEAYSLNLRPLFTFAEQTYQANPAFTPRNAGEEDTLPLEKVHQALTILQFKLEGQLSQRRPEFELEARCLLDKIDQEEHTVFVDGQNYALDNTCFQTIIADDPYKLNFAEHQVVTALLKTFQQSERLRSHIDFLARKGGMYLVYNQQLLFHGCIPLKADGTLQPVVFEETTYAGKNLLEFFDKHIRQSLHSPDEHRDFSTDLFWYAWCGKYSPLFGKEQMRTFERYFIEDVSIHKEDKNPYYLLRNEENVCRMILSVFGLATDVSHIINGHTPIKSRKGENPVKANGRLFVIDGGLSKAYQKTTGIGGYTLLYSSTGFQLVTHQPFSSVPSLINNHREPISTKRIINRNGSRVLIRDTTIGEELQKQIENLEELLHYLDSEKRSGSFRSEQ